MGKRVGAWGREWEPGEAEEWDRGRIEAVAELAENKQPIGRGSAIFGFWVRRGGRVGMGWRARGLKGWNVHGGTE